MVQRDEPRDPSRDPSRDPNRSARWSDLHARVHVQLKRRPLLPRSARVLLAVSGGQDSVCLGQVCRDLASRWNWTLAIGHCDHGWRDDSADNARFVADLADRWGVPYFQKTAAIAPTGEARARTWRYGQLLAIAREFGATHIATGHTASDRAETFLHHLLRGAGTDGLSAIARDRDLEEFCDAPNAGEASALADSSEPHDARSPRLVRPLFDIFRHETADFCRDFGLPVWEDATNRDERYTRNRIRHRLLPLLAEQFNPRVEAALVRASESLSRDRDCLERVAADRSRLACDPDRPDRLYRPALRPAHPAIQHRVIRDWLRDRFDRTPSLARVDRVVALIDAHNKTRTDPIVDTRVVEVCGDWLAIVSLPAADSSD